MESWTFGIALFGAVCGGIGAVLGVINTVHTLSQTRVILKVLPAIYAMPDGNRGLCVIVTNLSSFPVTVYEAGFLLDNRKRIVAPFIDLNNFPKCLDSRANVTAYFPASGMERDVLRHIAIAFASTACGTTVRGTSEILESLIANKSTL